MTAIPPLPMLDRLSPTFRADVDAFFGGQIQATTSGLNAALEFLANAGVASWTAESTSPQTIPAFGNLLFDIGSEKGFVTGQIVRAVSKSDPAVLIIGQVLGYSGSDLSVVALSSKGTPGSYNDWSISLQGAGGGETLLDIVRLESGTSWTAPEGATRVVAFLEGGCGQGGKATSSGTGGGGRGGAGAIVLAPVQAGTSYPYTIGAGGSSSTVATGQAGGATEMFGVSAPGGAGGSATGTSASGTNGQYRGEAMWGGSIGSRSAFGSGIGGGGVAQGASGGQPGDDGIIVLWVFGDSL